MMWTLWKGVVLCLFVGDFIAAQYARRYRDAAFPPDLSRLFENFMPFPLEQRSEFSPFDSISGPWKTPEINMFADLSPIMDVPRVEVSCDDSTLTVVVDKRSFGRTLTREEMQLGESCSSNAELPDKFVFSYSLDQCGTTHVMQDGRLIFKNSLHLNLKKSPANWLQTPSAIHISCMPVRSDFLNIGRAPPERRRRFNIRTMTSSWSHPAESNLHERGDSANLQISARIWPNQHLFVQSCFVSASPDPQTRPRHAVVSNKGCATPVGSPHPIAQFVASDRTNVVKLVLNTSHLISELYIHCNVIVSNLGVTYGSKSCNYNVIRSRWEELNGDVKVCHCCSSKCKGLSVRPLSGAKAIVSTGPLVIVDKESEQRPTHPSHEPQQSVGEPIPNHTEMEIPNPTEDVILSGASVSRCKLSSPGQGVMVVSQNRDGRRTAWLPGQGAEDCDGAPSQDVSPLQLQQRANVLNEVPELQNPTTQREPHPNLLSNELEGRAIVWDANLFTMVDGWPIIPQPDIAIIAEEFKSETMDPVKINTDMAQDDNFLPTEVDLNIMVVEDAPSPQPEVAVSKKSQRKKRFPDVVTDKQSIKKTRNEPGLAHADDHTDTEQIVRAKVEFSKGADGSKKLSYEEEVTRQREGKRVIRGTERNAMKRPERGLKGLRSGFLSLLRGMNKAE